MRPQVSTTAYEFAHGRKPRGKGQWAFFFDNADVENAVWFSGHFSEARAAAVAYAREHGHARVQVGS